MVCPKCGTMIRDNARFCYKCGASVATGKKAEEPQYELCQIEGAQLTSALGEVFGRTFKFWADARGPNGYYVAGELTWRDSAFHKPYGPDRGCRNCVIAHSQFIQKLVSDGWQLSEERGDYWYQLRFRRKISSQ